MKKVFGWIFIVCGVLSILKDIELIWVAIFFIILGTLMLILPTRKIPEKTTQKSGFGWTLIVLGLLSTTSVPFGGLLYDDTVFGISIIVVSIGVVILGIWLVNSPEKKIAKKTNNQFFNFFQREQRNSYQDDKTKYENLRLIKELLDNGVFTQDEFEKEKQKILRNSITDTEDKRGCTTDDMLLNRTEIIIDESKNESKQNGNDISTETFIIGIVVFFAIFVIILIISFVN